MPNLAKTWFGKLCGDKGYISQPLFDQLRAPGLELITPRRKNMKQRTLPLEDQLWLRQRSIIETINDQLKNISQIEPTRHRSVSNFLVNLLCGLIAYCHQRKKCQGRRNSGPLWRQKSVPPAVNGHANCSWETSRRRQ